jgi:hypothetical protein
MTDHKTRAAVLREVAADVDRDCYGSNTSVPSSASLRKLADYEDSRAEVVALNEQQSKERP